MANNTQSSKPSRREQHPTAPVLIIGAGLAGLYTALKLAPRPCLVIAAKDLGGGAASLWAQGGIAAAIGEGDTPEDHCKDTILAGAGLVDPEVARLVTNDAADRILDLLNFGVPFDKTLEGKISLAREAAHRTNRIVHVEGDRAGSAIMGALIEAVKTTPSIKVLEKVEVHRLEAKNDQVTAAFLWPSSAKGCGPGYRLGADQIVLATGGVGHLYAITTNPEMARGEGLAMAARIGAEISDAEFVQFHPTAMNVQKDPAPLATEALRGEGATLINKDGTRFMPTYHQDAELAPRDIVARAVFHEARSSRGAFLDCTNLNTHRLNDHYPTVIAHCKEAGLDPSTTPIPIAPAAHFHMGGVKTDTRGRTSIKGLWACGEVASTGLHGGNRLASNSLLEALVFANQIALDISGNFPENQETTSRSPTTAEIEHNNSHISKDFNDPINKLRSVMFEHVALERNHKGLKHALETIRGLKQQVTNSEQIHNMCLAAEFITSAALRRRESLASHYRSDEINTKTQAHRSTLTLADLASTPLTDQIHESQT